MDCHLIAYGSIWEIYGLPFNPSSTTRILPNTARFHREIASKLCRVLKIVIFGALHIPHPPQGVNSDLRRSIIENSSCFKVGVHVREL